MDEDARCEGKGKGSTRNLFGGFAAPSSSSPAPAEDEERRGPPGREDDARARRASPSSASSAAAARIENAEGGREDGEDEGYAGDGDVGRGKGRDELGERARGIRVPTKFDAGFERGSAAGFARGSAAGFARAPVGKKKEGDGPVSEPESRRRPSSSPARGGGVVKRRSSHGSLALLVEAGGTDCRILSNSVRFSHADPELSLFEDDQSAASSVGRLHDASLRGQRARGHLDDSDDQVIDLRPGGGRRGYAAGLDASLVSLRGMSASRGLGDSLRDSHASTDSERRLVRRGLFRVDGEAASGAYPVASKRGGTSPKNENKGGGREEDDKLAETKLERAGSHSKYDPPKHWDANEWSSEEGSSDGSHSTAGSGGGGGGSKKKLTEAQLLAEKRRLRRQAYMRTCARAMALFAFLAVISGSVVYVEDKEDFDRAFDVFPYNVLGHIFGKDRVGGRSERNLIREGPVDVDRMNRRQARVQNRMAKRRERRRAKKDLASRRRTTFQGPEEEEPRYYAEENLLIQQVHEEMMLRNVQNGVWTEEQAAYLRQHPEELNANMAQQHQDALQNGNLRGFEAVVPQGQFLEHQAQGIPPMQQHNDGSWHP